MGHRIRATIASLMVVAACVAAFESGEHAVGADETGAQAVGVDSVDSQPSTATATPLVDDEPVSEAPTTTGVVETDGSTEAQPPPPSPKPPIIDGGTAPTPRTATPDPVVPQAAEQVAEPSTTRRVVAAQAAPTRGAIEGTITDDSGAVVSSATVYLYRRVSGSHRLVDQYRTSDGSFRFDRLLPDEYFLRVNPSVFVERIRVHTAEYWQDKPTLQESDPILVTAGSVVTASPVLAVDGVLVGSIFDSTGAPNSHPVSLTFYALSPQSGTWEVVTSRNVSDSYAVGLDPGTYRVCAQPGDGAHQPSCVGGPTVDEAVDIAVTAAEVSVADVHLLDGASISGSVFDSTGDGLFYTRLLLYRLTDHGFELADDGNASADGSYRLGGLPAGTFRLCTEPYDNVHKAECWDGATTPGTATDIPLSDGQNRTDVNITVDRGGIVTGTISGVPFGIQGEVLVTAVQLVGGDAVEIRSEVYSANGTYTLGGLPPGEFRICFESVEYEVVPAFATECWNGSPTPQGADPVTIVTEETVRDVDFEADLAGAIRGTVSGPSGPISVQLYVPSGVLASEVMTDARGRYEFIGLPVNQYRVGFNRTGGESGWAAEYFDDIDEAAGLDAAQVIPIGPGQIAAGVDGTLSTGGTIVGSVFGPDAVGADACTVQARSVDESLTRRSAMTSPDGHYEIGGLTPGTYTVHVAEACAGSTTEVSYDEHSLSGWSADATAVTVDPPVGQRQLNPIFIGAPFETTIALTTVPTQPVAGEAVTLVATVTGPPGAPDPAGAVSFFVDGAPMGSGDLHSPATLAVMLGEGRHTVRADYVGTTLHATSTLEASLGVAPGTVTTGPGDSGDGDDVATAIPLIPPNPQQTPPAVRPTLPATGASTAPLWHAGLGLVVMGLVVTRCSRRVMDGCS